MKRRIGRVLGILPYFKYNLKIYLKTTKISKLPQK
tara:strand:- start:60889 stop:60993 length:105 start_codon:yes stop_codon:yes gene_type:complete